MSLVHVYGSDEHVILLNFQKLENEAPEADAKTVGIPNFWLDVLMNSADVNIYQCDVPILKHLTDITCELHSDPAVSPTLCYSGSNHLYFQGYTLSFHFSENPYFGNDVLKKSYELSMVPDNEQPFDFDGSVLVSCINGKVLWRDGKDVAKFLVDNKVISLQY